MLNPSSGHGFRAFCFGSVPEDGGTYHGDIEVYQAGKLLTRTGHRLEGVPSDVMPIQEAFIELRSRYFKQATIKAEETLPVIPINFTDTEIIDKLANFVHIWEYQRLWKRSQYRRYGFMWPDGLLNLERGTTR